MLDLDQPSDVATGCAYGARRMVGYALARPARWACGLPLAARLDGPLMASTLPPAVAGAASGAAEHSVSAKESLTLT